MTGPSKDGHAKLRSRDRDNGVVPEADGRVETLIVSDEAISHRAYHRFLARGCTHGFDKEDWEAANRELLAEAFGR